MINLGKNLVLLTLKVEHVHLLTHYAFFFFFLLIWGHEWSKAKLELMLLSDEFQLHVLKPTLIFEMSFILRCAKRFAPKTLKGFPNWQALSKCRLSFRFLLADHFLTQ